MRSNQNGDIPSMKTTCKVCEQSRDQEVMHIIGVKFTCEENPSMPHIITMMEICTLCKDRLHGAPKVIEADDRNNPPASATAPPASLNPEKVSGQRTRKQTHSNE